ncbi:hypothetical protein [Clostridium sp. 1001283B150210_160208_E6]|uniref:hypothetical protein n=1 Tax=Clostridium sp. 1001283B150210_160208_E6 TaxID=2787129 RepID=UPI0018A98BAB|nr:hypothetical protein [Clostridium sp. 1001283B150210_160208_E6]
MQRKLYSLLLLGAICLTAINYRTDTSAKEVNVFENRQNKLNKTYILKTDKVITSPKKQEFILTYYTDLNSENGYGAVNCLGERLEHTMIASNYFPLGTKIVIDGVTYEVRDRGSSRFNNPKRLDMFIPRNQGESNREYYKRVNNMGVKTVKGYIKE